MNFLLSKLYIVALDANLRLARSFKFISNMNSAKQNY